IRRINSSGESNGILVRNDDININSTTPSTFKGLRGDHYYGANYDDNTWVQKKYVDDNFVDEAPVNGKPYARQDGDWVETGGITESALKNTLRSFSAPQRLDVAVLTPASNVFTPNLGTAGSFTADIAANSTLANPTIPSGYDSGKVLAWEITFTITGAGGWTLAFGNQYFVDADVDIATIISDNNTTGDVIQLFFQFKNNVISVQPFIPTAI